MSIRQTERITQTKYQNVVGNNIRKIRKAKGIKATEIVKALQLDGFDISTGTFSKIESGMNNPSVEFLMKLVKLLDCDFNTLFEMEE